MNASHLERDPVRLSRFSRSAIRLLSLVGVFFLATHAVAQPTEGGAQNPPSEGAKPGTTPATSQPKSSKPVVTLIDPGAEPRQARRFQVADGSTQLVRVDMQLENSMSMNDRPLPPQKLPPFSLDLSFLAKASLDGKKGVPYESTILKSQVKAVEGVNPNLIRGMSEMQKHLEGIRMGGVFSPRGMVSDAKVLTDLSKLPPEASQAIGSAQQTFDQLSFPLPEEPLGVGAKWETRLSAVTDGMRVEQTILCEVRSIDGGRLDLTVVFQQSAPEQTVTKGTQSFRVQGLRGRGRGSVVLDLAKIAPISLDLQLDLELQISPVESPDEKMGMKMNTRMKIEPGSPSKD